MSQRQTTSVGIGPVNPLHARWLLCQIESVIEEVGRKSHIGQGLLESRLEVARLLEEQAENCLLEISG